ncbi:MAG: hypothetical protein PVH82_09485 [Desulfobacteraceae bacterium]
MLVYEAGDLWICSCGNWVGRLFTWCPECAEDREAQKPAEVEAMEADQEL